MRTVGERVGVELEAGRRQRHVAATSVTPRHVIGQSRQHAIWSATRAHDSHGNQVGGRLVCGSIGSSGGCGTYLTPVVEEKEQGSL